MTLDELNDAVGYSSYEKPERVCNGYRLFRRGFIPSDENDLLVDVCLAWPESSERKRYYYSAIGSDIVGLYEKGKRFIVSHNITKAALALTDIAPIIRMKDEAMQRLCDYVAAHELPL